MSKITYLDGVRLYRALVAGIRQVISRQEQINNINVYPVPDRDTGTNMAMTLNAVLEGTYASKKSSIDDLLNNVADSALNGARGNSGAILAQFFQGLSEGAEHIGGKMSTSQFVAAIDRGVKFAYSALSKPKEGTILTVIRDFSIAINDFIKKNGDDFLHLLQEGIKRANESLQETKTKLKELKKANVVDAGAQGFVELLTGIYDFIENGSIKDLQNFTPEETTRFTTETLEDFSIDEKYRFCTECLIIGENINQTALRNRLDKIGSSLIVAGSRSKTKIHIHANDPAEIFNICREYGALKGEKADDMIHQQSSINHKRAEVAILTDSGADLPSELISQLDIHVVPIIVSFGNDCFIDKVTLTAKEFYHLLKSKTQHPKTSQPSFGDFARQYQYLTSHYDSIIAIHLPKKVSGTLISSQNAAKKTGNSSITILDALSTSGAQGLIVRHAAELAKAGKSQQEIIHAIGQIAKKTKIYVATPDLTFVERGGRLSTRKRKIIDALRLTPILSFDETGKVKPKNVLFGRKNIGKKLAKLANKKLDPKKNYRIIITHCDARKSAEVLKAAIIEKNNNIDAIDVMACGPALGAHTGPGSLAIAIQEYP